MELCQNVDNAVVLARRGEIRSPENCLLCVFGQANLAPTADDEISRLVLTPPAFNIYKSLLEKHTAFLIT